MGKLEFVILGKIVEIIIYQAGRKNFLLMNGIQIKNKVIELFFSLSNLHGGMKAWISVK